MRCVLRLALSLSLLSLSSVYAGDSDTVLDVCEYPSAERPAANDVQVDRLPRNSLCHPSSCPKLGDLSWIGRTNSGTRFWVDSTRDLAGALQSISLEDLQEIESNALRSFLKPSQGDPRETVVRVYDEDGLQYEERKIRFGSLPRDFVLDMRQRTEKVKVQSTLGAGRSTVLGGVEFSYEQLRQMSRDLGVWVPGEVFAVWCPPRSP